MKPNNLLKKQSGFSWVMKYGPNFSEQYLIEDVGIHLGGGGFTVSLEHLRSGFDLEGMTPRRHPADAGIIARTKPQLIKFAGFANEVSEILGIKTFRSSPRSRR